jgi:methionyl-tRNA formyltransferase
MPGPPVESTIAKRQVAVLSVSSDFWESISTSLTDVASLSRISTPQQLGDALAAGQEFDLVLVPHWRWLLPPAVLATWRCIGFHTSPLPKGRGGSPIQNQIVRGMYDSELCAYEMNEHVDAGGVLAREFVDLSTGSIADIMASLARQVGSMSRRILLESPKAVPQYGEPSLFERRRPEESEIPGSGLSARQLYDRIRMVDGLDYPRAFIEFGLWRLTFTEAKLMGDVVHANVTWSIMDGGHADV